MLSMNALKPESPLPFAVNGESTASQEVRCAVRFPLALPVVLSTSHGEVRAFSRNVSASGVLFELGEELPAGLGIRFSLRMPGEVLGTLHDVLVHCLGRVVRCSLGQTQYLAAATIDEYQFAEQ
jgi:PilZ domain